MHISTTGYRFVNGKVLTANGQRRVVRLLNDEWTPYEEAFLAAVAAIEHYTQTEPEFIPIDEDFAALERYYDARREIAGVLNRATEAASDLDYLRENFRDISTEIDGTSGVVLSGFVGVKDAGNSKVVAGMAGAEMEGAASGKHGKLMLFAGADGIRNAVTATTRIYEDGHMEVGSGIFSGYSKVLFKQLDEEGTLYDAATRKYTVDRNFNLVILGERYEEYLFWLNLPSSADFIGSVLNLYDSPIRTRSAANLILAADDPQSGIVTTLKRGLYGFEPVPRIETYGGVMQLLAVPTIYPDKCMWHVTYQYMTEFKIYEA